MTENNKKISFSKLSGLSCYVIVARVSEFDCDVLFTSLSPEERDRAVRFRKSGDRFRHIVAHALKRMLLANVLEINSQELQFAQAEYGKPYCLHPQSPYFNISHSGDWVALAFSYAGEVGVDVEFPQRVDIPALLSRICSAKQLRDLEKLGPPSHVFWYVWSQKEAVSKANGRGLSVGVEDIDVSGLAGHERTTLFANDYELWSRSFEGGVLSYAFTHVDSTPGVYQLLTAKGALDSHSCCFYEL